MTKDEGSSGGPQTWIRCLRLRDELGLVFSYFELHRFAAGTAYCPGSRATNIGAGSTTGARAVRPRTFV